MVVILPDYNAAATLPPPVATQFYDSCNLTMLLDWVIKGGDGHVSIRCIRTEEQGDPGRRVKNTHHHCCWDKAAVRLMIVLIKKFTVKDSGAPRRVLFMYGFAQAPTYALAWPHFIIIVCILGCAQPIGALLNFVTLGTLCKDARKGSSISVLLQALVVFDIFYLGAHFTGVFLPAFFQTISNASNDCVISDVAKVRVRENVYFDLSLGITRDLVVWQMILISEYCLIPYCCAGNTTKRLYNKCFAIFETIVVFVFVGSINVFMFLCKTQWSELSIASYYPMVEMFNVFLPFGCILVMYFGVVVQIITEKMSGRQSWDEHCVDQLYRGFGAMFLFVICEVPYIIHWILRWNLAQNLTNVFGYYIIAYVALLCKHINSAMKLFVFSISSARFRQSLGRSCRGEEEEDHHFDDDLYVDKAHEDDHLMHDDDPDLKRNAFLEVTHV